MSELLGTQVGNIRLVDLLGRGGMGEVYAGYDVKLNRKVAVKAIRREHRLDEDAKARLLREARSLSRLDHPNICRIYDYVEGEERDLLVLELIEGKTLKDGIRDGISGQERLRFAEQVAQVLVAAHAANIVHRDLKPDNVMLTPGGDVKVLDFGISRSLDEELAATVRLDSAAAVDVDDSGSTHVMRSQAPASTGGTREPTAVRTRVGSVIGTVAYMSPEQARGEIVTPASDMYAFGLLLQELFTGKPPMDPAKPPHQLLVHAARGESNPVSGVDRDLAELIGRLKQLEPERRPTAVETAQRLRWIREKPARRMRRLVVAAAVVLVVLAAAKYTFDLRHERDAAVAARESEKQARLEAEKVLSFLTEVFEVSDPGEATGSTVTARELLDRGAERVRTELADQPLVRARLMGTMGIVYRELGLYKQAEEFLVEVPKILEAHYRPDHYYVATALDALASLYVQEGRYAEAAPLYERALAIFEKREGPERADLAGRVNNLAIVYRKLGKLDEAERLYRRALSLKEEVFGPDHPTVASSLHNLAVLHFSQDRFDEAERLCRRALAIRERSLGVNHPDVAASLTLLAQLCWEQNRHQEAEELNRRALAIKEKTLPPTHPELASSINNLAAVVADRGDYAEAEGLYRRALEIFESALGPESASVVYPLVGLANAYRDQKRYAEAEPLYRRALAVCAKALPADHKDRAFVARQYAELLRATGRAAEAASLEGPVAKGGSG